MSVAPLCLCCPPLIPPSLVSARPPPPPPCLWCRLCVFGVVPAFLVSSLCFWCRLRVFGVVGVVSVVSRFCDSALFCAPVARDHSRASSEEHPQKSRHATQRVTSCRTGCVHVGGHWLTRHPMLCGIDVVCVGCVITVRAHLGLSVREHGSRHGDLECWKVCESQA